MKGRKEGADSPSDDGGTNRQTDESFSRTGGAHLSWRRRQRRWRPPQRRVAPLPAVRDIFLVAENGVINAHLWVLYLPNAAEPSRRAPTHVARSGTDSDSFKSRNILRLFIFARNVHSSPLPFHGILLPMIFLLYSELAIVLKTAPSLLPLLYSCSPSNPNEHH